MPAVTVTTDLAAIDLRLAHRWIASTYWAPGIPWATFERSCAHSLVFAALDGGAQVGFARVVTDQGTFAWLADVFVAEHARGRGVASSLLGAIVADERLQGLRNFVLATADAHPLYERFGFVRLGDRAARVMAISRLASELYEGDPSS